MPQPSPTSTPSPTPTATLVPSPTPTTTETQAAFSLVDNPTKRLWLLAVAAIGVAVNFVVKSQKRRNKAD